MKAWILPKLEGLSALQLADIPDPIPAVNEAVITVEFAALNPADRYLAEKQYPAKPSFPHILGRDGLGTIASIGSGVAKFKVGDRVIVLRSEIGVNRPGTFAERVAVPVESLARVPQGWSDEQACGAALVYLTAYQSVHQWGDFPTGAVVLITGASGGVGVASVQLCSAMGFVPVALSRDESKRQRLLEIGAKVVLDPMDEKWPAKLKEQLPDRRVDLAIDNIGGALFNAVLGTLGYDGKVSVVGRLAGPVPEFNAATLFFRRIKIGGVHVGSYKPAESQAAWKAIVRMMDSAGVKPIVDSTFEFDRLLDAFERLEKGPMGKVILKIK